MTVQFVLSLPKSTRQKKEEPLTEDVKPNEERTNNQNHTVMVTVRIKNIVHGEVGNFIAAAL